jgi:hypothetical protein
MEITSRVKVGIATAVAAAVVLCLCCGIFGLDYRCDFGIDFVCPTGQPPDDRAATNPGADGTAPGGPGTGGTAPGAGDGRSVETPDTAGGYPRVTLSASRPGDQARLTALTAAGLRDPATASYHEAGTAPEPVVVFAGGDWMTVLTEADVTGTAEAKLREAFAKLPYTSDGTTRAYDAGPLGGEVRCATLNAPDRKPVVCGWVDRWTLGYILDVRRDRTEAQVVQLLLAMRPDLEKVTP